MNPARLVISDPHEQPGLVDRIPAGVARSKSSTSITSIVTRRKRLTAQNAVHEDIAMASPSN
jgi:hypothetical protein